VETLVINRPTWLRNQMYNSTLWRCSDDCKCCLGFYLKSIGMTKEQMEGYGSPADIYANKPEQFPEEGKWLLDQNRLTVEIIHTNDSSIISDDEREARLIELFAVIGIQVIFTDDPEPVAPEPQIPVAA
jgi:hypothetical protein